MRKSDKTTGTRGPDGKNIIKAGGRFTNMVVPRSWGLLATAFADCLGYCEVKWVDGWTGGASAVRTSGWGSPECSLMNRDIFIWLNRTAGCVDNPDGVSSDTPIRDIVDRCRVWESH